MIDHPVSDQYRASMPMSGAASNGVAIDYRPFDHYKDLPMHKMMLKDRARCEAYQQALARWVKPSDIVLDMGAGTGILSMFAAQAGARKVYAVERTGIVEVTRKLISDNGFADRIEVIQGDMEEVELPEKVDVLVSEWMGGYGVDENFLPALVVARDRWLKPGGKVLPEAVSAWIAPVCDSQLERNRRFWLSQPYGIDLGLIEGTIGGQVSWFRHNIGPDSLFAEPQQMWTTDIYQCSFEQTLAPFRASLQFPILRQGRFNALAAWFEADFGDGIILSTAPDAPETCWGRTVFSFNECLAIRPGEQVEVEFSFQPQGLGRYQNYWSARVGKGEWQCCEFHM